jgi:hypothetical protein
LVSVGLLAASSAQAAGCTIVATTSNVNFVTASADNQCNDGDDLKMFVDKSGPLNTVGGSLGSNNDAFDNINTASTGGSFETDGSGFANFKSTLAGDPTNALTSWTFTMGTSTTLPDGTPFPGFDGQLFRGQIDDQGTSTFDGDLIVTVNFADGTPSVSHTFTGLPTAADFGVVGFDEVSEPGHLVSSVVVAAGAGGVFDELKQLEFSVPGAIAVPERSTWGMMLLGFAGLGFAGYRRARKGAAFAA